MKVLLIKSVEDLGLGGDVVDVANGYARNYLFPRNLAVKATSSAIKSSESYRSKALEEQTRISNESQQLADKLRDFAVEIKAAADENGHLYGSVNERHISDIINEAGFDIDIEQVLLSEHLKAIGEFPVTVKIYGDIRTEIVVRILREEEE
ncbi:50S ribosomal protein L9 [Candidatus Fermentibacteria bacterium]|nr:MAG: 50S ribosomal protein L9 [Candidatus Fermentibacteria bacterium]